MYRWGNGSSPTNLAPPCLERPPNSATSMPSRSCSVANAPTRSGGAWPVTNRTGFTVRGLRRTTSGGPAISTRHLFPGGPQRVLVGGERVAAAALPGEVGGHGLARALAGLAQPVRV